MQTETCIFHEFNVGDNVFYMGKDVKIKEGKIERILVFLDITKTEQGQKIGYDIEGEKYDQILVAKTNEELEKQITMWGDRKLFFINI